MPISCIAYIESRYGIDTLTTKVNEAILLGWQPYGNVVIVQASSLPQSYPNSPIENTFIYVQAMVRY